MIQMWHRYCPSRSRKQIPLGLYLTAASEATPPSETVDHGAQTKTTLYFQHKTRGIGLRGNFKRFSCFEIYSSQAGIDSWARTPVTKTLPSQSVLDRRLPFPSDSRMMTLSPEVSSRSTNLSCSLVLTRQNEPCQNVPGARKYLKQLLRRLHITFSPSNHPL